MMTLALVAGLAAAALALVAATLAAGITVNLWTGVPYAPCPPEQIERVFDFLALGPGSRVYDLGCGDGRVLAAAARRGAKASGYELEPLIWLWAYWRCHRLWPNANVRWGDFRTATIADATVIFCFLVDTVMAQTAAWLRQRAPRGCTIVCYGFPLPGWTPTEILHAPHPRGSKFFIYRQDRRTRQA